MTQKSFISSYSVINGAVEINITGLMAEKLYAARVSARNNLWEGSPSDPFTFETSKRMKQLGHVCGVVYQGIFLSSLAPEETITESSEGVMSQLLYCM